MSRDTYVVHNAYFDSGGPWGIFGATVAGYIETVTGRPFSSYFNCLSGASIGGVNATSLAIQAPAVEVMHNIYACAAELLKPSSHSLVMKQIINQKVLGGRHLFRDHYDHGVLYRTLKPYYGDMTMGDAPVSLLVTAHNMNTKKDVLLGCIDDGLFDAGALQMPLVNGSTPLIDGAMATTSIPGIFEPYVIKGGHYHDNGMTISAGMIHKELDAALKARQKAVHDERDRRDPVLSRRRFLSMGLSNRTPEKIRTLANTDHALVRTLFLGTGDMSELPYTPERHLSAGFLGAIDDHEYSTLHAAKGGAVAQNNRDMARMFDPASIAATGLPAITTINRSIIPRPGTDEAKLFPTTSPLDARPVNLHKVFYVAGLSVADNRERLGNMLREIADTQLAQGALAREGHAKACRDAQIIATQDPWPVLERIIVTDKNGPKIRDEYAKKQRRLSRGTAPMAIPA